MSIRMRWGATYDLITWLYGPMAAGADTVLTIFLQTSLLMVSAGFMVTTEKRWRPLSVTSVC